METQGCTSGPPENTDAAASQVDPAGLTPAGSPGPNNSTPLGSPQSAGIDPVDAYAAKSELKEMEDSMLDDRGGPDPKVCKRPAAHVRKQSSAEDRKRPAAHKQPSAKVYKRPGAKICKRPGATICKRVSLPTSQRIHVKCPKLGCGKCRGSHIGCVDCRDKDFTGSRWQRPS